MGRFYRRRIAAHLSGADLSGGASYPPEAAVPSMQTVGERRFYVVPENQISVIEAPPSYDDALKHPAVPASRTPAYMNRGFLGSTPSEERMVQSPQSEAPPPPEGDADTATSNASEADDERSELTSPETVRRSPTPTDEPGTSGLSSDPLRKDDESWV
ncbi:hypothetical protein Y032_0505g2657 [Ancylostoma ceylanicum]|uniref:Uncharacterized protein n=1 Tax=Ancylostoma ceylanicum TaxID=53326 RepID=A0A016WUZ6_9BILA|nr:hypothetical protein Y032_0505g2657 [Ancylostoma ceylanicum]